MNTLAMVLVSLLSLTLLPGEALQQREPPVGMVLDSKGEVFIERETGRIAARLAELLYPGDLLLTLSGGVGFLFCPSQEQVTLHEDTSVELSADGMQVIRGRSPLRSPVGGCALPRVALGSESLERVGGLRARGHPPIVLYVGGQVLSARPTFQWEPIEDADSYVLTLKNELGAVLWEQHTRSAVMPYPEAGGALQEGTYRWDVRAEGGGRTLAQQWANLTVKPNPNLRAPSGHEPGHKLIYAAALEAEEYFSEAADCFRELRQEHPNDLRLTRHLAWLYWNAGLIAAANQERQRLGSSSNR